MEIGGRSWETEARSSEVVRNRGFSPKCWEAPPGVWRLELRARASIPIAGYTIDEARSRELEAAHQQQPAFRL